MTIPENQLVTWSHQGSTTSASCLYERIRNVLLNDPALKGRNFEVFLQGSYRNSTNIRGDSDVDVVVKLNDLYVPDTYMREISERGSYFYAPYTLTDFRRDLLNAVRCAFHSHEITEGGKSIKIPRTSNNIPADVVPCVEYRLKTLMGNYIEGIWLRDVQRGHDIISFPKQSYDNGVAKHGRTNQWYKSTVRIFKNARSWMEDNGLIQSGIVSSYAIESLLYNVPDQEFVVGSYNYTFFSVVDWLDGANMANFVCQNGIQRLFDSGRWTQQNARAYIDALKQMWNQ